MFQPQVVSEARVAGSSVAANRHEHNQSQTITPLDSTMFQGSTRLADIGSSLHGEWSHVEWGAANYGDSREDEGGRFIAGAEQHALLLKFIDRHIERYGPQGTIFLNDLEKGPRRKLRT